MASQVKKIQDITGRISQIADEGEYGTSEYLNGKMMTDLHVDKAVQPCERPKPDERVSAERLKSFGRR